MYQAEMAVRVGRSYLGLGPGGLLQNERVGVWKKEMRADSDSGSRGLIIAFKSVPFTH
jgi:hypothetical protein